MNSNGILVDEDQLAKEKAYVVPSDSEIKSKFKMSRLEIRNKFDAAQALLVNYIAEDYRFLLKKILALISIIPSSCKTLIVPLPRGCTHIDQFYAKRIQRIIAGTSETCLMILFITHESHR